MRSSKFWKPQDTTGLLALIHSLDGRRKRMSKSTRVFRSNHYILARPADIYGLRLDISKPQSLLCIIYTKRFSSSGCSVSLSHPHRGNVSAEVINKRVSHVRSFDKFTGQKQNSSVNRFFSVFIVLVSRFVSFISSLTVQAIIRISFQS